MQRQYRVQKGSHQGLMVLREQGKTTPAAQLTGERVAGMISIAGLIHVRV